MNTPYPYLGQVIWQGTRGPHEVAQLHVFAMASDDGLTWASTYDTPTAVQEFPDEGCVSWIDAPPEATLGSCWYFERAYQSSYLAKSHSWQKRDKYKIRDQAIRALEVFDLRGAGDGEELRQLVTRHGVDLPAGMTRVCLRLAEEWWVDDVPFVPLTAIPHMKIIAEATLQKVLFRVCWHPHGAIMELEDVQHRRRVFLAPKAHPVGPRQAFEWTPEETLLRIVLRKAHDLPRFRDNHKLTNHALDELARHVAEDIKTEPGLQIWQNRLQRARELLAKLNQHDSLLGVTVEELLAQPPVQAELEVRKQKLYEEEQQKVKDALAEQAVEVERRKTTVRELDKTIADRRQEQATLLDQLDAALEERLTEIQSRPAQFLAEVTLLRSVLARESTSGRCIVTTAEAASGIGAPDQLCSALGEAIAARGLVPALARPLHATLLAGLVPLLDGVHAPDLLRAYAACVTGGAITWVTISSGVTEPRDLLEREGLADALRRADGAKTMHLVVLDGVNRAASELFLNPLLPAYADAWQRAGRPLPGGSSCWPRNVLLTGTLAEGSLTFPIPGSVWRQSTLLPCDPAAALTPPTPSHPDLLRERAELAARHAVSSEQWASWRQAAHSVDLAPVARLWERTANVPGPDRGVRDACLRLFAADRLWPLGANEALEDVAAICLVPALACLPDAARWLETALQQPGDWKSLLMSARRYAEGCGQSGN